MSNPTQNPQPAVKLDKPLRSSWINFLALVPSTSLTLTIIGIAFLRFYDERDFTLLGIIAQPRDWSNRLTVAAILLALGNFGVEWNRRNRETDRLAQAEQRRLEEVQRREESERRETARRLEEEQRTEESERREAARRSQAEEQATRRDRIENERDITLLTFLGDPSDNNRMRLNQMLELLAEYRATL